MRKTTMEKMIDMHKLLVHAIIGARLPVDLGDEYIERGLAYFNHREGRYAWEESELEKQPTHVLQGIYQRITA